MIDAGANGIEMIPKTPDDISVGDIISYKRSGQLIVHRVIEKGEDDNGYFFRTKGDNNLVADPGLVRFDQVQGVLFAVVY